MTTRVDIIAEARKINSSLFEPMNPKSSVFISHMKLLNVLLLKRVQGLDVADVPFFPGEDILYTLTAEAYVQERGVTNITVALNQAKSDAAQIDAAISRLLGGGSVTLAAAKK